MNDLFYYMDDFIYYYAWLSIVVGILFIPVKSIYNAFCFQKGTFGKKPKQLPSNKVDIEKFDFSIFPSSYNTK